MRRADIRALRDGFNSGAVAPTTLWRFPRSLPAMLGAYDEARRAKHTHQFAIVGDGRCIGVCSLQPPRFSGSELTIAIFEPRHRGKGVGTYAVTKVCEVGFFRLGLRRIELGVYPDNRRAIACYARCGFKYEALLRRFIYHDGRFVDLMWMSLLRSDYATVRRLASRPGR